MMAAACIYPELQEDEQVLAYLFSKDINKKEFDSQ